MTKKEIFATIITVLNGFDCHDYDEFLNHEIDLLAKKRSSDSKSPTKRQKENIEVKERIAAVLTDEGQTVTEILKKLDDAELTNQRVSALLKQMGARKEIVKGKSYFFA